MKRTGKNSQPDDFDNCLVISPEELEEFHRLSRRKEGRGSAVGSTNRLELFWQALTKQLPPKLQNEAREKGLKLVPNPNIASDPVSRYFAIKIPGASKNLEGAMDRLEPIIICHEE